MLTIAFFGSHTSEWMQAFSPSLLDDIKKINQNVLRITNIYHYTDELNEYDIIIPLVNFIDAIYHNNLFRPYFPHTTIYQTFRQKYNFACFTHGSNIVPPTYVSFDDFCRSPQITNGLYIIKPNIGSFGEGMSIKLRQEITRETFTNGQIVQQYFPNNHEYKIVVVVCEGRIIYTAGFDILFKNMIHIRNSQTPDNGINRWIVPQRIIDILEKHFFYIGFFDSGICDVDIIFDGTEPYILEINPSIPGILTIPDFRNELIQTLNHFCKIIIDTDTI